MRPIALLLVLLLPLLACDPEDKPPPVNLRDRDELCQRPGPEDTQQDETLCEDNIHHSHDRIRWYTHN